MFMMKLNRLWVPALFGAVFGFAQPANATTTVITLDALSATATCTAAVAAPVCEGFLAGTTDAMSALTTPTELGILSPTNADLWNLANSAAATATSAINTLTGLTLATGTKVETGGVSSFSFITSAAYFMLKIGGGGQGDAFFKNNGGIFTVNVDYDDGIGGEGGGLSHIVSFGGSITRIPLPAALPIFLLMLGGAALVARRRRGVSSAA